MIRVLVATQRLPGAATVSVQREAVVVCAQDAGDESPRSLFKSRVGPSSYSRLRI